MPRLPFAAPALPEITGQALTTGFRVFPGAVYQAAKMIDLPSRPTGRGPALTLSLSKDSLTSACFFAQRAISIAHITVAPFPALLYLTQTNDSRLPLFQRSPMRIIYLICLLISCTLLPLDASAASRNVVGVIKRFECGDNCYLTISRSDGKLETGLCVAKACEPWNAEASMPKSFIGRRIKVSIGMGTQLDGNGNEVGRHESFDTIEFLDQAKKGTKAD